MMLGGADPRTSSARETRHQRRMDRLRQEHVPTGDDVPVAGSSRPATAASAVSGSSSGSGIPTTIDEYKDGYVSEESSSSSSSEDEGMMPADSYVPPDVPPDQRNVDSLTETALAVDRFCVSNRAAAAIINAFQVDIGRVSSTEKANLVDPKKIWRARAKVRGLSLLQQKRQWMKPQHPESQVCILTAEKIGLALFTPSVGVQSP